MGNLFLKEKENWWVWLLWSAIGAALSYYSSYVTEQVQYLFLPASFLLLVLTWWMNYSKRYEFSRAFKVLLFVGSISFAPLLYTQNYTLDEITKLFVDSAFVLISLTCVSLMGAFIAKRPKQYY
ncbi:hypothetical protein AAEU28_00610 [Pseudoalteromonas sp. SS15]|jgi:uncharacterized membrane protein YhaH (DUF805 family)|uniref:Transmembrane protein n=1 Tax=Pseudoalteromonas phenolica TaxID=161398 RepID=A0A5S3YRA5_9GAMM|nr:hypothetical protein [Pseudoalteromonas phenolica]TMP78679.1 hypothetical protein CWB73_16170 [Pseudoalteromonas phenolica]